MDTFKHKGLRKKLVEEIRSKGITSEAVLDAINEIPRHQFLDGAFLNFAYEDKAFPIGEGQTISQPYTVAFQSSLLNIKRGDKVLEIGTGSGYQTMVLFKLGAKVFSIERQKALFDKTKKLLVSMNCTAKCFYGDGYLGLPAFAPFDKILVTAGAPYIPDDLKNQLKIGGTLVVPVGGDGTQKMYELRKISETEFEEIEHGDFKFVPFLKEKA
ncbi:MAG: protein-L-isoaspartate(D-aspartate) O-methyltransferase [Flavobacteriales bacterium]|nr:protein-L-isoaspartate(D-aspartate) O-methyltransferase [Flavobacteriales bacterium]